MRYLIVFVVSAALFVSEFALVSVATPINGVKAQLGLLGTSHARLETAIARAEAEAYRQSATPAHGPSIDTSPTTASSTSATKTTKRPRRVRKHKTRALRR